MGLFSCLSVSARRQGKMSVLEYSMQFTHLAKYALHTLSNDKVVVEFLFLQRIALLLTEENHYLWRSICSSLGAVPFSLYSNHLTIHPFSNECPLANKTRKEKFCFTSLKGKRIEAHSPLSYYPQKSFLTSQCLPTLFIFPCSDPWEFSQVLISRAKVVTA